MPITHYSPPEGPLRPERQKSATKSTNKTNRTNRTKSRNPRSTHAEAKRLYVEGIYSESGFEYPTFERLAQMVKENPRSLEAASSREKWASQREKFREQIEGHRRAKLVKKIGAEGASFDLKCFRIANKVVDYLRMMLMYYEVSQTVMPIREQRAVVDVLQQAQRSGRLALGKTTDEAGLQTRSVDEMSTEELDAIIARAKASAVGGTRAGGEAAPEPVQLAGDSEEESDSA